MQRAAIETGNDRSQVFLSLAFTTRRRQRFATNQVKASFWKLGAKRFAVLWNAAGQHLLAVLGRVDRNAKVCDGGL